MSRFLRSAACPVQGCHQMMHYSDVVCMRCRRLVPADLLRAHNPVPSSARFNNLAREIARAAERARKGDCS